MRGSEAGCAGQRERDRETHAHTHLVRGRLELALFLPLEDGRLRGGVWNFAPVRAAPGY